MSLDDFAKRESIEKISLLKIDTEGAEAKILRGARKLLETGRIRVVIVEFGPFPLQDFGDSVETFLSAIHAGNGSLYLILPNGSLSSPLTDLELQQLAGGDVVFIAN